MRFIEAIKNLFARMVNTVAKAASELMDQTIVVTDEGMIIVQEPTIQKVADKFSALLLASVGVFLMYAPVESKALSEIGDQMLRAATRLWSGAEHGDGVQPAKS